MFTIHQKQQDFSSLVCSTGSFILPSLSVNSPAFVPWALVLTRISSTKNLKKEEKEEKRGNILTILQTKNAID